MKDEYVYLVFQSKSAKNVGKKYGQFLNALSKYKLLMNARFQNTSRMIILIKNVKSY